MDATSDYLEIEVIEEFNDDIFDLKYSIQESISILENLDKKILSSVNFDNVLWIIEDDYKSSRYIFNFEDWLEIGLLLKNVKTEKFIKVIKCWTAGLLTKYSVRIVHYYFTKLKEFIVLSKGFDKENTKELKNHLEYSCGNLQRYYLLLATKNFLDYYDQFDADGYFKRLLWEWSSDIDIVSLSSKTRSLPPSHEVMIFSWVMEDYWGQINFNSLEYHRYIPIYLWWALTNLIPIRPSEFCHIERNCLFRENERFYIKLPREKQKASSKKIQIVDKISIPENLFNEIESYIKVTQKDLSRETLISYKSIPKIRRQNYTTAEGLKLKLNKDMFSRNVLAGILYYFYIDVVQDKYGYTLNPHDRFDLDIEQNEEIKETNDAEIDTEYTYDISRKIRPGDTRHFAFLNLMRQGYHPLEIARLGGHTNISSQYHYHQHAEYWDDTEILQLMTRLKFHILADSIMDNTISSLYIDDEYKNKHVFEPGISPSTKIPLEIGYCTDPLQYCQVSDCCLCDAWRISAEEFMVNGIMIEQKIQNSKEEVRNIVSTLKHLHRLAIGDSKEEFQEHNHFFNHDLTQTAKELDHALSKHIRYTSIRNSMKGTNHWKRTV